MNDSLVREDVSLMSESEARQITASIYRKCTEIQFLLLDIHRRRGYVALGYRTFSAYVEREFRNSLQVGNALALIRQAMEAEEIGSSKPIPRTQLNQLKSLPTKDDRREAWRQITVSGVKITSASVRRVVQGMMANKPVECSLRVVNAGHKCEFKDCAPVVGDETILRMTLVTNTGAFAYVDVPRASIRQAELSIERMDSRM